MWAWTGWFLRSRHNLRGQSATPKLGQPREGIFSPAGKAPGVSKRRKIQKVKNTVDTPPAPLQVSASICKVGTLSRWVPPTRLHSSAPLGRSAPVPPVLSAAGLNPPLDGGAMAGLSPVFPFPLAAGEQPPLHRPRP